MTSKEAEKALRDIRRVVFGRLPPSVDREDVAGEVFLYFLTSGRVISNKMIWWRVVDWLRKHGRDAIPVDPEVLEESMISEVDLQGAEDRVGFLGGLIKKAGLENSDMDLLYGRFYAELSFKELAEARGMEVQEVRGKVKKILDTLKEIGDEEGK